MNLITVLIIILIISAIGFYPAWPHAQSWGLGFYPSGGIGLVVVILIALILLGRI